MATQTAIEPEREQPVASVNLPVPLTGDRKVREAQRGNHDITHAPTQQERHAVRRPPSAPERLANTTVLIVGAALVAISVLFIAGLMRSRIERGVRHAVDAAGDIDIPLMLPVSLAQTVWELIASRREVAQATFGEHTAK